MYLLDIDEESLASGQNAGLDALLSDLRRGDHARAVVGETHQRQLAAKMQSSKVIEGAGNLDMNMVVDSHLFMEVGVEYGFDAWDDPEFIRDVLKRRPECRVRSTTGRTQILNPWGQPARA